MGKAIAPWTLAVALIASFAADAGQEASFGASLATLASRAPLEPADLLAWDSQIDVGRFGMGLLPVAGLLHETRLLSQPAHPHESDAHPDELFPRKDVKSHALIAQARGAKAAQLYPAVDRNRRGDPFVAIRPGFEAHWRQDGALEAARVSEIFFSQDDRDPVAGFALEPGDAPGPDQVAGFQPWGEDGSPITQPSTAEASPRAGGSAATKPVSRDGATPATPRSIALSSTTPVARDATPIEIAALPRGLMPNASIVPRAARPDYAALLDPDHIAREKKCLAEAIYFEARSESEQGQAAVAQVVLNRVKSGLYPETVCGVVYQNRQRHNACQFSFACEGKSLRVTETDAWRTATRIADEVTDGETYLAAVGGATHYHANYVRPRWSRRLKKMDVIGRHIFYKLRDGQT